MTVLVITFALLMQVQISTGMKKTNTETNTETETNKDTALARREAADAYRKNLVSWAIVGDLVEGGRHSGLYHLYQSVISDWEGGDKREAHRLSRWALFGFAAAVLAAVIAITFIDTGITAMSISSFAATTPLPSFNGEIFKREEFPCELDLGEETEDGFIIWVWGEIAGQKIEVYQAVDSDRVPVADELVGGIDTGNIDGVDVNVPSCGTVVVFGGTTYKSPSARVAQAVGRHIDDNKAILMAAFDAMMYRQHEGSRLVLGRVAEEGDQKAAHEHGGEGRFELREELGAMLNPSPILRKISAETGIEVRKISLSGEMSFVGNKARNVIITKLVAQAGYSVLGIKDDKLFVVNSAGQAAEIFQLLGCAVQMDQPKYSLVHTPEVIRRVGALLGRKGMIDVSYVNHGVVQPEEMDGQKAVLESMPGIFQGTGYTVSGGTMKLAKGIVRPPIRFRHSDEDQGYEGELQFGHEADEGEEMTFTAFDRATEETASINQQIVGFTAADQGAGWYESLAEKLSSGLEPVMSATEQKWLDLGFDSADILPDRALNKFARKFDLDAGYRSMVIGIGKSSGEWMLGEGEVLLPARIIERMELERGDTVRLARDPGQPDGKSIREFTLAGELRFVVDGEVQQAHDGVAISANSEMWSGMGGDFDGDSGVVWPAGSADVGELTGGVDAESTRQSAHRQPLFRRLSEETLRSAVNQAQEQSWSIGIEVNKARRLWVSGQLDAEVRSVSMALAQGSIDAKKHLVDAERMRELQAIIEDLLEDYEIGGDIDLISVLSSLKQGDEEFEARYCKTDEGLRLKVEQGLRLSENMLITSQDGEQTVRVAQQDGQYVEIEHVSGTEKPKTQFRTDVWARMLEVAESAAQSDRTSEAATAFADYLIALHGVREEHLDAREGAGNGVPQELAQRLRFALAARTEDGESAEREEQAEELYRNWCAHLGAAENAETEQEASYHDAAADRIMDRASILVERGVMSPGALMSVDGISTYFLTRVLDPRDVEDYLDVEEESGDGVALF
jgi:hypothetical protein